ncbi:MAG TPA: hypothetical protein VN903_11270 [Polyangia bacterium]|jgi:hypothetical protein|nr:hypothetical protein [Polyangia bacterium]
MDKLISCSRCEGFLPSASAACPNCDARPSRRRRVAVLLGLAGSASLGLTMMACYGCPPGECRDLSDASGDTTGGGSDAGVD